jgi:hypothetical protein
MPREIPQSTLHMNPHWDITRPMSELNWRYVSVQAGLGKNVKVGQEAGKSVQACIAVNENPLRGAVAKLRQEEMSKESNVLPLTLSPRVPAPAVDGRMMGKGAKRSVTKISLEEDKENLPATRKGTMGKNSVVSKVATTEDVVKVPTRRLAPPARKPSGTMTQSQPTVSTRAKSAAMASTATVSVTAPPTLSQRVVAQREDVVSEVAGPKRTLRGTKDVDTVARPPTRAEINVPSRVPSRIQAQRATLKRTETSDNLKQDAQSPDTVPLPRLLRSRPPSALSTTSSIPETKIPIRSTRNDHAKLIDTLRAMGDNLTLALNTPPKRLSSNFRTSRFTYL